jgi:hypothetical protein
LLADHGVHSPGRTEDAIDRAGLDAQRAADARAFVDQREPQRPFGAVRGVQCKQRAAANAGESGNAFGTSRRAAVDAGLAGRDRLRIAAAIGVAAARALRLRQRVVESISEVVCAHAPIIGATSRLAWTSACCARLGRVASGATLLRASR